MKTSILFILLSLSISIKAQITLEHTYDSASTIWGNNQLMLINFEVSGERYVKKNVAGQCINIYGLNHSLIKTISYAPFPQTSNGNPTILALSEKLFDLDNKMEFIYLYGQGSDPTNYTRIYNEDGILLFSADSMGPFVNVNDPQQQHIIYNTSGGTIMILSHQYNGQAKVFSLPGTLTTAIAETNGQLMQAQGGQFSNLYPNPGNGIVTLQYELPKGEQYGEIILYNTQGAEVKRYKVDNTFNDILIDNTMLPAGTYYYQLQTGKGAVGTKKMVVVK